MTNDEWITQLALPSPRCDAAIILLRNNLVKGLRYALQNRKDVDEAAIEDFVQDSLIKILSNLDSFRSESLFTTWAFKIAVRTAYTELRKRRWRDVSLESDIKPEKAFARLRGQLSDNPEKRAIRKRIFTILKKVINSELTVRQKNVLTATMFRHMPLEEVARRLGTNRNSLYKLMYDARKNLKKSMLKQGLTVQEVLEAFD